MTLWIPVRLRAAHKQRGGLTAEQQKRFSIDCRRRSGQICVKN
jgi:hypothetical protein